MGGRDNRVSESCVLNGGAEFERGEPTLSGRFERFGRVAANGVRVGFVWAVGEREERFLYAKARYGFVE